jgi:hypothetical protein
LQRGLRLDGSCVAACIESALLGNCRGRGVDAVLEVNGLPVFDGFGRNRRLRAFGVGFAGGSALLFLLRRLGEPG